MNMKAVIIAAALVGGLFSTANARGSSTLCRQAAALDQLSDRIAWAHRGSLQGHCIEGENARFLQLVHGLQCAADRFRSQVHNGSDTHCLAGTLASIRRSYSAVRSKGNCIRLWVVTREALCEFGDVLSDVCLSGHEHGNRFDDRDRYGYQGHGSSHYHSSADRSRPSNKELIIGTVARLLSDL